MSRLAKIHRSNKNELIRECRVTYSLECRDNLIIVDVCLRHVLLVLLLVLLTSLLDHSPNLVSMLQAGSRFEALSFVIVSSCFNHFVM